MLAGLQEQLEPMACLTGLSDAKAKPFPEELLPLEPGRKWLEDRWVAAAQKAAEACWERSAGLPVAAAVSVYPGS